MNLMGLVFVVIAFYAMYWIIRSGVSAGIQDAAAKQRDQQATEEATQSARTTEDQHPGRS